MMNTIAIYLIPRIGMINFVLLIVTIIFLIMGITYLAFAFYFKDEEEAMASCAKTSGILLKAMFICLILRFFLPSADELMTMCDADFSIVQAVYEEVLTK